MKKLILLLLFTTLGYAQAEFEKIALTANGTSTSTVKINTQETDGQVNYINATALPISTATQSALNTKQATLTAGTNITIVGATINATVPTVNDASTTVKGIVKLAGDLGGTADLPTVPLKANLASPALTGTPTAPTATAGTNTTQIATTAFVTNGLGAAILNNGNSLGVNLNIGSNDAFDLTLRSRSLPRLSFVNNDIQLINVVSLKSNDGNSIFNMNGTNPYLLSKNSTDNTNPRFIFNAQGSATSDIIQFRENDINKVSISKLGATTATSFIKSGATTTDALLAGGGTLANPISGTGTANFISKWTGAGTQGNSSMSQDGGGNMTINGGAGADVLSLEKSTGASIGLSGATGTTNKVILVSSNATNPDFEIYTGGSQRFRIASTGAATFTSSVTVNGGINALIPSYTNDAAADSALVSGAFYKITGSRVIYQKP